MAHVREELALGQIGRVGLFFGTDQFGFVSLTFRDIRLGSSHPDRPSAGVPDRLSARQYPFVASIFALKPILG